MEPGDDSFDRVSEYPDTRHSITLYFWIVLMLGLLTHLVIEDCAIVQTLWRVFMSNGSL